ncbi:PREDICTED: 40S ribosomal protein S10, mitochondrial-like [Camelina sativa]|uniref:40S ribosomal protein S10, mitochondrial-like n=1 Tax=Camelina sativa TaxID=90675 RepID=A0ABM0Z6T6_CAMSA|nr:PREDICTED: 40S ribosomal protein S10, mitochondrial-like [Camelina sativa]
MITGVLRRSSLPSRHALSAALSSFDSCLSHNLTPASTAASSITPRFTLASSPNSFGITARRDFHIRSEPPMFVPAGIAFHGYATAAPEIKKSKIKIAPENVKPLSRKEIALQKEAAAEEESTSKIKGTKICIAIRSFDNPEKQAWCLPPHTRKVAMPDTRTLYTVLRSPHVDKKSREQFEMRFKKRFLVIKAQSHELSKKLFWLKRYRILGAQYELQFHCKTRLDMTKVFGNINDGSTTTTVAQ